MATSDIQDDPAVVRRENNRIATANWRARHPERNRQLQIDRRHANPETTDTYNRTRRVKKKAARVAAGLPTWDIIREPRTTQEGRVCTTCRERKTPSEFGRNLKRPDGLRTSCKVCVNLKSRDATLTNPDRRRSTQWASWLWKQYKLTIGEYTALWERQSGKCQICYRELGMGTGKHAVDHCHSTGFVRGILCHHCNAGLGLFQDSAELLLAAAHYLKVFTSHPGSEKDDD